MKLSLDKVEVNLPSDKDAAARYLADMFVNRGRLADTGEQVSWQGMYSLLSSKGSKEFSDTITSTEIRPLLQQAMEIMIREPVEPLLNITGLYNRVQSKGLSTQVLAGAMGAVFAQDVQEQAPYPEVNFSIGGAVQTAWIGKSGIAASFSDEALRYSTWDIMAMNLRLMGQAMARHKEQKAVAFLRKLGTSLFDNAAPARSLFGVTTGRGLDMAANGSLTMDDLFKGMAHMAEEGFQPDAILVNPLFFYCFIQDPVLRAMMLAGAGGQYFTPWNGQAGPRDPWSNGAMGAQGPSLGNRIVPGGSPSGETATGIAGREHGMTAAPPLPASYFPWGMRVIVSPFVPFDASTQLGDAYLVSSGNVGFHLVDEELTQVEWRDEGTESVKMKLRERYGFAVAHEGQGVGVIKNLKLARNFWDGTVHAETHDVDAEIEADAVIDL
jgi:hypothetical protein